MVAKVKQQLQQLKNWKKTIVVDANWSQCRAVLEISLNDMRAAALSVLQSGFQWILKLSDVTNDTEFEYALDVSTQEGASRQLQLFRAIDSVSLKGRNSVRFKTGWSTQLRTDNVSENLQASESRTET